LLTDAHLSPNVAEQINARRPDIAVYSLRHWREGSLLQAEDAEILARARTENLTLVTYDQRTIAPLLTQWAMEGREHSGVVFISKASILQSDRGGQVRALIALYDSMHTHDWTNAVAYLKPEP